MAALPGCLAIEVEQRGETRWLAADNRERQGQAETGSTGVGARVWNLLKF